MVESVFNPNRSSNQITEADAPVASRASGGVITQREAQNIQKNSGVDSASSDIAQVQGVLSASEKAADTQTILMDALNNLRKLVPFDDFVFYTLLTIISIAFLGAVIYIFVGRWI
jgi:hypothetical protein